MSSSKDALATSLVEFVSTTVESYLPESLYQACREALQSICTAFDEHQLQRLIAILQKNKTLTIQLSHSIVASDYILQSICRNPDLLFHCLFSDAAFSPLTTVKIFDAVEIIDEDCEIDTFDKALRQLRRQLMVCLYWRDLNGLADFKEVGQAMTSMAEAFTQKVLNFHFKFLQAKHGTPIGKESGEPQTMLVIGMGKLGGSELNVSSDIDLLFVYPEGGVTNHPGREIDNQKFFTLLGQRLIKSLNEITEDGFVFRVDMRLRPYGQSGALVSSFAALENYYYNQGRDWERFAGIKARVIASANILNCEKSFIYEEQAIEDFYKIINPFVYRKYIDFSTVESLRQLKEKIIQEVRRRNLQDDIKLGAGGIREIEFIAQSFQLVYGGKVLFLQEKNLLITLEKLLENKSLNEYTANKLSDAYIFLRKSEHTIQAINDKQTQLLPSDDRAQTILAWVMGFENWREYFLKLEAHRQFVSSVFNGIVAETENKNQEVQNIDSEWRGLWEEPNNTFEKFLIQQDIKQVSSFIETICHFKQCRNVQSLSAVSQTKLDKLIPILLSICISRDEPEIALKLTLEWLETIVTRTSYLDLLLENPEVINRLMSLFVASSWVADTLTRMPSLLDELLNFQILYSFPTKVDLRDELRQRLLRIETDDTEAQFEALRYFKLAHNLHAAASEIAGELPLMKASDYLTFTAEVVLEEVLQLAWRQLVHRHGYPEGASIDETKFLIIGYGKLGGLEMSYSSDLDLVFIYDGDIQGMSNGDKPLDNQTFYTRLGQKIIHILNVRTLSGKLYEVDMRLRPSGNSGLLVSSLASFSRYQQQEAWIWEHQALVRARPIVGDEYLVEQFQSLRLNVLSRERSHPNLKSEVLEMREKMRKHLGSSPKKGLSEGEIQDFHLKQGAGGIVDIEFMVQYAVLAWGTENPAICEWTDNIRIIETLRKTGFIEADVAKQLTSIYKSYRQFSHRLSLQQKASSVIAGQLFKEERQQIIALWDKTFH